MVTLTRLRRCLVLSALLAAVPLVPAASAQEGEPTGTPTTSPTVDPSPVPAGEAGGESGAVCTVTGYVVGSVEEMTELRAALREEGVHTLGGLPLDGVDTWVLPDGGMPVMVVDSTEPLPGGVTSVVVAGSRYEVASDEFGPDEERSRYATNVVLPHLGPTVRTLGLEVASGDCAVAVTLSVERSALSTVAGGVAAGVSVLFGLLTVLVGRLRKGGWPRRFLSAAPLGVLTGAALGVVLVEAGVVDPFSPFPWWPPVAGLVVAALLPLTRWRGGGSQTAAATGAGDAGAAPAGGAGDGDGPAGGGDAGAGAPAAGGAGGETGGPVDGGSAGVGATAAAAAGGAGDAGTGMVGSGRLAAAVNAAVAVLVAAGIGVGVVAVDPDPARAGELVITPDRARVIFVDTMAEAWGSFAHVGEDAQGDYTNLREAHEALADTALTGVGVGVPRDQYAYPAWFVAWATIPLDELTASVFARFDRATAEEDWRMSSFRWSVERRLPAAVLDEEGWLAPSPAVSDLLVDPASLAQRYQDWLARVDEEKELVEDEVLTLRFEESGFIHEYTLDVPFFNEDLEEGDHEFLSYDYEMQSGAAVSDLIPLVDGTTYVTFPVSVIHTTYNSPSVRTIPCDFVFLRWRFGTVEIVGGEPLPPSGRFRSLAGELVVTVEAWVPIIGAASEASEASGATPAPTAPAGGAGSAPEEEPPADLELAPVDPTRVMVEDWRYRFVERGGKRC